MSPTYRLRRYPLNHIVIGVLSLAAQNGVTRVPNRLLYRAFADLVEQSPDSFPPMRFTRTGSSAYSKRFEDALQSLIGYSVELPNPRLKDIVTGPDAATRHLAWLEEVDGHPFIEELRLLAKEIIDKVNAAATA